MRESERGKNRDKKIVIEKLIIQKKERKEKQTQGTGKQKASWFDKSSGVIP
jgi:hypothetical protein